MSASRTEPASEVVMLGAERIGSIVTTERGHQAFGPRGDWIATYASRADARRGLLDRHHDAQAAASVEGKSGDLDQPSPAPTDKEIVRVLTLTALRAAKVRFGSFDLDDPPAEVMEWLVVCGGDLLVGAARTAGVPDARIDAARTAIDDNLRRLHGRG
jgi:hypothetical protein